MKTVLLIMMAMFMVTGCVTKSDPDSYQIISTKLVGTVEEVRPVVIKDDGSGKWAGITTGAILGSFIGGGSAQLLGSLGGGLAGWYAGEKLGEANAEQLTVKLDDGSTIVVVAKGQTYAIGDHVEMIKQGDKVINVYKQ